MIKAGWPCGVGFGVAAELVDIQALLGHHNRHHPDGHPRRAGADGAGGGEAVRVGIDRYASLGGCRITVLSLIFLQAIEFYGHKFCLNSDPG
jgi:hypothetical protein